MANRRLKSPGERKMGASYSIRTDYVTKIQELSDRGGVNQSVLVEMALSHCFPMLEDYITRIENAAEEASQELKRKHA